MAALGGTCRTCGFAEPDALHVDHVNGDGAEERRSLPNLHPRTLLRLVTESPSRYQLLCGNCNCIKREENGEHCGARVYQRQIITARTLKGRAEDGTRRTAAADDRRMALLAAVAERRPLETSAARLPQGSWSRHWRRCLGCQRDDRRHAAEGLCTACNAVIKKYTRRLVR